MNKHGRREYLQVLRLLESFELADLHAARKQALHLGATGRKLQHPAIQRMGSEQKPAHIAAGWMNKLDRVQEGAPIITRRPSADLWGRPTLAKLPSK